LGPDSNHKQQNEEMAVFSLIDAIKSRMKKLHNQLGKILKRQVLAKYSLE
jgi:hypothetical protein